ncbi:MAG: LytR/AlgR family response regulator transcription factor [bacterium]
MPLDKIRTLIVDDEPLARDKLKTLLADEPEIEIIAECADGRDAVATIRRERPDLVFLDVQMPELDGFGVLDAIGASRMPGIIFVTAYDQYALRAFDVHALDYLLKPFDRERFQKALQRAKAHLLQETTGEVNRKLLALLEDLRAEKQAPAQKKYIDRLVIKASGRVFFLETGEIDWIEAAGNYVRLHTGTDSHLLRDTMSNLEANLDPEQFLRIHRSIIVRIDRIKEFQPWFNGEYVLTLRSGEQLTSSRGYRGSVGKLLGNGG